MSESWVKNWDEQEAWNQKCRGKSTPDSAAVLKLKSMLRNLLATRDEADAALDVLRGQGLPDLDLDRFIDSDGLEGLHKTMKDKGATVLPSDKLREHWQEYYGGEGDANKGDPVEARIRAIDVGDDGINFWLHMFYRYEAAQREHVAYAVFCDTLQVNPDGEQTNEAFARWEIICMLEQLDDEFGIQ
jgi:hypothetical protein